MSGPHPSTLVVGQLAKFVSVWESISTDCWVLDAPAHGHTLEFKRKCPDFPPVARKENHIPQQLLEV